MTWADLLVDDGLGPPGFLIPQWAVDIVIDRLLHRHPDVVEFILTPEVIESVLPVRGIPDPDGGPVTMAPRPLTERLRTGVTFHVRLVDGWSRAFVVTRHMTTGIRFYLPGVDPERISRSLTWEAVRLLRKQNRLRIEDGIRR